MPMLIALISSLVFASSLQPGTIGLPVSPGASAVLFPRSAPNQLELGIYGNRVPIEIDSFSTQWVGNANVTSVGGGTWFVSVQLRRDDLVATLESAPGEYVVRLSPGNPEVLAAVTTPTIDELISGNLPRRMAAIPAGALHPLGGDASLITMDPAQYPIAVFEPPLPAVPTAFRKLLSTDGTTDWKDIDRYRQALTESTDDSVKAVALVRLGIGYLDLGFAREAEYYLRKSAQMPGFDVPSVHLAQARAAFGTRHWDRGREYCVKAAQTGGEKSLVLECLAIASAATATPPPTETARALLPEARRPLAKFLAAQLLQKDNRHAEALPVLQEVADQLDGDWRIRAYMSLGDAYAAAGNSREASFFWARANTKGELEDLAQLRVTMGEMIDSGPRWWAGQIPYLMKVVDSDAPGAIEALYLLGQVSENYGDSEQAAGYYAAIVDRRRLLAARSDVPEHLANLCTRRMENLYAQGRTIDHLALYRLCWRPLLDERISDAEPLEHVRDSYEKLGMFEEALRVQKRAATVQVREERNTASSLEALVRLYAVSGRGRDALEALAYARRTVGSAADTPRFALLEGIARRMMADRAGAIAAWSRAARSSDTRKEAEIRISMLQASTGQCPAALTQLRSITDRINAEERAIELPKSVSKAAEKSRPDATSRGGASALVTPALPVLRKRADLPNDIAPDAVRFALARCLHATGRSKEAVELATNLAANSQSAQVRKQARELAASLSYANGKTELPVGLAPKDGLWDELIDEEQQAAAFSKALGDAMAPIQKRPKPRR